MEIELNKKEQALLDLLTIIPPDLCGAEQFIRVAKIGAREVTRVAISYADMCFLEGIDYCRQENAQHFGIIPNLHSTYICDILKLLLQYGLEPNGIYDRCNIMEIIRYVDNEFLAADSLALLLEHGGDPALIVHGEPLFQSIDFDVFFDAVEQYDRQRYASLVHCWMVLIGYGAKCNEEKIQIFKEYDSTTYFDLQKLKDHRNYYFGLTHLKNNFAISIYDKATHWEVARFL